MKYRRLVNANKVSSFCTHTEGPALMAKLSKALPLIITLVQILAARKLQVTESGVGFHHVEVMIIAIPYSPEHKISFVDYHHLSITDLPFHVFPISSNIILDKS